MKFLIKKIVIKYNCLFSAFSENVNSLLKNKAFYASINLIVVTNSKLWVVMIYVPIYHL